MGCCGRGKKSKISINNDKNKAKKNGVRTAIQRNCPLCKWPIRTLHSYDGKLKKVINKSFCTNIKCNNYKGIL